MTDTMTATAVLRRNVLFRGIEEAALQRIGALAIRKNYEKGTVIFSQGDEGDALYGVASGQIRIGATGSNGQEVFLSIMEPGDTFGEIAVMDGLPRTAGATALERSTLYLIKRSDFLGLIQSEPVFAVHVLKLLCMRLRWTSELVEESIFLDGPARLAKKLLILANRHGHLTDRSQPELRISQEELAHFLGITRQIVNHHLGEWQKREWVRLGRAKITILDTAALNAIAKPET